MPDTEGSEKKRPGDREFMREKIVKQHLTKAQLVKRAAVFVCLAVLFGMIAAVSFVLAEPFAGKYLRKNPPESTSILFDKDEPETTAAAEPEVPETEAANLEAAVEKALSNYKLSVDDLNSLYAAVREVGQQADRGIVTVSSGKQQLDLFGNPVESTGDFAGAVIAKTSGEFLIFTYGDAVRQADSISVSFFDGSKAVGQVKQLDEILNMAVVAVKADQLPKEVCSQIAVLPLGNSYSVKTGDFVIGAGSPAGFVHSTTYGSIAYIGRNVQMVDAVARVLYADIRSNSRTGTFLLNTAGEIVGWTSDQYKTEDCGDLAAVISISDYKATLGRMTNGQQAPFFGVKGQEVTDTMTDNGIPQGVYVMEAVSNGPAYDAGIQNGDIITQFGEKEITTFKELQIQIESARVGAAVPVKVMRKGRNGYIELRYVVNIRAR